MVWWRQTGGVNSKWRSAGNKLWFMACIFNDQYMCIHCVRFLHDMNLYTNTRWRFTSLCMWYPPPFLHSHTPYLLYFLLLNIMCILLHFSLSLPFSPPSLLLSFPLFFSPPFPLTLSVSLPPPPPPLSLSLSAPDPLSLFNVQLSLFYPAVDGRSPDAMGQHRLHLRSVSFFTGTFHSEEVWMK